MASRDRVDQDIINELNSAQISREAGNEGKMRVHTRRAVGWAIREYYLRTGIDQRIRSAYEYILYMQSDQKIPADLRANLEPFVQRVVKDSSNADSYWPLDVDLIEQAKQTIPLIINIELSD